MKNDRLARATYLLALALPALEPQFSTCLAQGSLTPPGAPAPMFKTLAEIEPRRLILTCGTNLTQSGSYYLGTNLVSSATNIDGITISADNATVDLNGFAIINTGGNITQSDGISFTGRKNVTIRNGTITGFNAGFLSTGTLLASPSKI